MLDLGWPFWTHLHVFKVNAPLITSLEVLDMPEPKLNLK
ncbi:hypothetical protein DEDE109153_16370 [Deinococcus deserti]